MKPPGGAAPGRRRWRKPLGLYAVGQATLLAGAWATQSTGSMLPLALAGSACLMLTAPAVRAVRAAAAARRGQARPDRL